MDQSCLPQTGFGPIQAGGCLMTAKQTRNGGVVEGFECDYELAAGRRMHESTRQTGDLIRDLARALSGCMHEHASDRKAAAGRHRRCFGRRGAICVLGGVRARHRTLRCIIAANVFLLESLLLLTTVTR